MKASEIQAGMILYRQRRGTYGRAAVVEVATRGEVGGTWVKALYHRNAFGTWRPSTGAHPYRIANRELSLLDAASLERIRAEAAKPPPARE